MLKEVTEVFRGQRESVEDRVQLEHDAERHRHAESSWPGEWRGEESGKERQKG